MKAKKIIKLGGLLAIFSFMLPLSHGSYANESKEITPYDFYQGIELSPPNRNSAFYWLELPANAYMQSAYPDTLQDVRVFNGTGDEVPSALFFDTNKSQATSTVNFTSQRLVTRADNVNSQEDDRSDSQYILVESVPGKVNRIELPNMQRKDKTTYQAYLLSREQQSKEGLLTSLNLAWANSQQDWQAKIFVYASSDKKEWMNIAANQPVMSLKLDSGVVSSNTIELLRGTPTELATPYLMLVIVSPQDTEIPDLKTVSGFENVATSFHRQESFLFEVTNDGNSREQVIYRLPMPQPISELSIKLQQSNRVIPLKIEYISSSNDEWKPLKNIMVFNQITDGERASNPNLMIDNKIIKGLRITALKGSWDELPPTIYGMRDAINLVVNMQGAEPFLLVWGNKQVPLDKANYTQLIGHAYNVEEVMSRYPEITTEGKLLTLGGVEKRTQTEMVQDNFNWMVIALWALLFMGIVGLLYLCWYLFKQVNSSNGTNSER
ncbi:DUF3999 family protein [Providencia rustigianii]|uniref:DUF3999 family protein n=1 Tax=Providencia rustigianii TaxID=158850 RepID=UPI000F6F4AAE|nr:DUF3999 family protein [Providencia rustigianii]MTC60730.1 DUF3999 family protein [Providencia rustigianii]VEH55142.1 Uncharacterised protein [Providencia rustigianii]